MFFNILCDIENNLLTVFNKLNNSEYTSGIVNLSTHSPTQKFLSYQKGWVFAPPLQGSRHWQYNPRLDDFKRKTRLQLFFSGTTENPLEESIQSGGPFEHNSFKLKSTFNPVGPFQLESMFYSIEQDLHRQKYKQPRDINLTKEEYQVIKSLKHNPDIIIKPADKDSAIVVLDKQSYIQEGQRQLNDTKFYEQTDSNHTGEVINKVNLHVHNMLQRVKYPEKNLQLPHH